MVRGRATAAVALLASLAVLAACRDGGDDTVVPSATVPTAPPQTTTTNPYSVPQVIDTAYVGRVVTGLDAVTGDVVRLIVSSRTIPREAFDRLRAIYATDAGVDRELALYSDQLSRGLTGYRADPGNQRTTVSELISANESCVFFTDTARLHRRGTSR